MKYRRALLNEIETREYIVWAISNANADVCMNYEYAVVLKTNLSLSASLSIRRVHWAAAYPTGVSAIRSHAFCSRPNINHMGGNEYGLQTITP